MYGFGQSAALNWITYYVPANLFSVFDQVKSSISVGHALVVELLITFELVFTVFATCDNKRNDLKGSASLAIGIAVVIGHLFAVSQHTTPVGIFGADPSHQAVLSAVRFGKAVGTKTPAASCLKILRNFEISPSAHLGSKPSSHNT